MCLIIICVRHKLSDSDLSRDRQTFQNLWFRGIWNLRKSKASKVEKGEDFMATGQPEKVFAYSYESCTLLADRLV